MKFTNPRLYSTLDPSKITLSELSNYKGRNCHKLQNFLKSSKIFAPVFIASTLTGVALMMFKRNGYKKEIYGNDNRGGEILSLKTYFTPDEIEHNRVFQEFKYTSEPL